MFCALIEKIVVYVSVCVCVCFCRGLWHQGLYHPCLCFYIEILKTLKNLNLSDKLGPVLSSENVLI